MRLGNNNRGKIDALQEVEKRKKKFSMKITVKGRKTGILRSGNVWFVLQDGKIYARTSYDRNWLKNVVANQNVIITISDFGFQSVAEELKDIQNIDALKLRKAFREKYGFMDYFARWFMIRGKERFVRFSMAQ